MTLLAHPTSSPLAAVLCMLFLFVAAMRRGGSESWALVTVGAVTGSATVSGTGVNGRRYVSVGPEKVESGWARRRWFMVLDVPHPVGACHESVAGVTALHQVGGDNNHDDRVAGDRLGIDTQLGAHRTSEAHCGGTREDGEAAARLRQNRTTQMTDPRPRRKTTMKSNARSYAPKEHEAPEIELGEREVTTEVELYSSPDGAISLPMRFDGQTVWATQDQMTELFGTTQQNVSSHLRTAYDQGELDEATHKDLLLVRREGARDVSRKVRHYDLDAIISVGYRVNSSRGVHFRRWASGVLRQRVLEENAARLRRMERVTDLLVTSSDEQLASIGRIMQRYSDDLDRLADYDRNDLASPNEQLATARIEMNDVERIVDELRDRYPADERLGVPKDDSIHGVLGQIEQTFMGQDLYPSAQEKAANLLYMVVKDHPFGDGNKRTGAALFAYFLDRNGIEVERVIPGNMLTALTLIAAASDPSKKDETVALIRSLLSAE